MQIPAAKPTTPLLTRSPLKNNQRIKIQRRHLHFNDSPAMQEGITPRQLDSEFSPLDLSARLQETHVTALGAEDPAI